MTKENKMKNNLILTTDSYKLTHHEMYAPGMQEIYSYFECRDGAKFDNISFFGLQYILKNYIKTKVTSADIDEAEALAKEHFGTTEHFNRKGWEYIVKTYDGILPLSIYAIPEGTWVKPSIPLITVQNTDPNCFWLTNYVETVLSQVWYPTTVATLSGNIKRMIKRYFDLTVDPSNHGGLNFMLHDFGFRGASSVETAGVGGMAHLVHFMGTDTLAAMKYAEQFYGASMSGLAFSVPASEHSVMTSDCKGEQNVLDRLLKTYKTGILSVVADSYDIYNFVKNYMAAAKNEILSRDGVFVVRPDSITPKHKTPHAQVLWICKELHKIFGATKNNLGYYEINPKVKVLWGDGIDYDGIEKILSFLESNGYAASNIATFGMGGGLLQKVNRDTLRCAFKCSNRVTKTKDGVESVPVLKNPLDASKRSKGGKFKVTEENGVWKCENALLSSGKLRLVYQNGMLYNNMQFNDVRDNAKM
jgi:nicotinamide phosphoribosyltransferase